MPSAATSHARIDLVAKLLRRALDPVADIGEATNAAGKMVLVARREGIDFSALTDSLLPAAPPRPITPAAIPVEAMTIMPFGKFVGMMLIDIAREDVGYVAWMATQMHDHPDLLIAARVTLRHVRGEK